MRLTPHRDFAQDREGYARPRGHRRRQNPLQCKLLGGREDHPRGPSVWGAGQWQAAAVLAQDAHQDAGQRAGSSINASRATDRASRVMRPPRNALPRGPGRGLHLARLAERSRTPYHIRADYDPGKQASRTRTPRSRRQGESRARPRNRGRPASRSLPG